MERRKTYEYETRWGRVLTFELTVRESMDEWGDTYFEDFVCKTDSERRRARALEAYWASIDHARWSTYNVREYYVE